MSPQSSKLNNLHTTQIQINHSLLPVQPVFHWDTRRVEPTSNIVMQRDNKEGIHAQWECLLLVRACSHI